jgi:hypothetical protein
MCRRQLPPKPCMNYKCPHNLFWKGLSLNSEKFKITNKSLEIGNCCCLINEPWTAEEIREVWGLTMEKIMRCEGMAWEKIHKKNGRGGDNQSERFFLH